MSTITVTASALLNGVSSVKYPVVTIEDGCIAEIYSDPKACANDTSVLAAAFLDVHTHGAMGYDVMSASQAELSVMQRFLATRGVGHYLPTTITAAKDMILCSLEKLASAIERGAAPDEATPVAIHLEGPFLSHTMRGVHPSEYLLNPTPALLDEFQAAARGNIALVTIAPELPGALETIGYVASIGIRTSLGHSDAIAAEAVEAIAAGASSTTHTFNAMRSLGHREPGLLGTALDDPRLFAELICDGIHVIEPVIRMWWKTVGPERGILVTDAMSAAGKPDGAYTLGGLAVTVRGGKAVLADELSLGKQVLAGSLLTMDRALANFTAFTQVPIEQGLPLTSSNPARMLGRDHLAAVHVGAPANLLRLGYDSSLQGTWLHGRQIPSTQ